VRLVLSLKIQKLLLAVVVLQVRKQIQKVLLVDLVVTIATLGISLTHEIIISVQPAQKVGTRNNRNNLHASYVLLDMPLRRNIQSQTVIYVIQANTRHLKVKKHVVNVKLDSSQNLFQLLDKYAKIAKNVHTVR
jgi:hypothetical protein